LRTWDPAGSTDPEGANRTELDLDALDDSLRRAQKQTTGGHDQMMME